MAVDRFTMGLVAAADVLAEQGEDTYAEQILDTGGHEAICEAMRNGLGQTRMVAARMLQREARRSKDGATHG